MRKLLAAVTLLVAAVGCGEGGGGNITGPSTQPFSQTVPGTVTAFDTNRHALTIPRSGNMNVRLTWPDGGVDLDLFLSVPSCVGLYPKGSCGIVASSDAGRGTQEGINRTVNQGESFNIFVDNLHLNQPQSYTLTISIN